MPFLLILLVYYGITNTKDRNHDIQRSLNSCAAHSLTKYNKTQQIKTNEQKKIISLFIYI